MLTFIAKINPGVIWLLFAIVTDVLSTFYSAKGDGLVNKLDQGIALVLYIVSFTCAAIALNRGSTRAPSDADRDRADALMPPGCARMVLLSKPGGVGYAMYQAHLTNIRRGQRLIFLSST